MHMQMGNSFSAVFPIVDHKAETIVRVVKSEIARDFSCREQQVAQNGFIICVRLADAGNELFRDHKNVHRRLRCNIPEGEATIVLMDDVGGNLAGDDFFEESHVRILNP